MSSITTRLGDDGTTRLYSGEIVSKSCKRMVACGEVDELVTMLGMTLVDIFELEPEITYIQRKLFVLASEIATNEPKLQKLPERIDAAALAELDQKRDELEAKITLPKGFILPGACRTSANIDMCRVICRKIERTVVDLFSEGSVTNKYLLMWINRLSDYLYLLARRIENNHYRMVKPNGQEQTAE